MCVFKSVKEALELTENWIREYDEERPHDSLDDPTPWEYRFRREGMGESNFIVNIFSEI